MLHSKFFFDLRLFFQLNLNSFSRLAQSGVECLVAFLAEIEGGTSVLVGVSYAEITAVEGAFIVAVWPLNYYAVDGFFRILFYNCAVYVVKVVWYSVFLAARQ